MANPTTNLGMTKPTVGGSTDTWGTTLNENVIDTIDAVFGSAGTDVSMAEVSVDQLTIIAQGDLRLADTTGGQYIALQAAGTTTSYTLTMPAAVGSDGQVLSADGAAGVLEWTSPEVGDITAIVAGAGMTGTSLSGPIPTLNVIGTADKITVSADAVTIASTYVGQTSITTLGTIATGTWEGTTVAVDQGGTGATSLTDGGVLLGSGTGAITATSVLGDGEILIGDASGDPATLDVGSSTAITILGTVATGVWNGTAIANANLANSTVSYGGVSLALGASDATPAFNLSDATAYTGDSSLVTVGTVASGTWNGSTVAVAYGGTGATSLTDGGVLLGSGTGAITATAVLGNGEILIGDASGDPATLDVGSSSAITILGTVATGVWNGTAVGLGYGGTGFTGYAKGDIIIASATNTLAKLSSGSDTQVLTLASGAPTWASPTTGDLTAIVAGAGLTGTSLSGPIPTLNVIGTSGTITVSADAVTIASDYVGQGTITTLGTIGTGVWQGSQISGDYIDVTSSPLANTKIWIGDSSGDAAEFALSGNATMTAGGVVTVSTAAACSGLAATATALATARAINGTDFDGTAAITVTAAAGTVTGATLNSGVTASSLTSVGTITSLVATTADINAGTFDGIVGGTTPADGSFSTLSATGTSTLTGAVAVGAALTHTDLHSTWGMLQVGEKGSVISEAAGSGGLYGLHLTDNLYIDSGTGNWAVLTEDESSRITQNAGVLTYYNAASVADGTAPTQVLRWSVSAAGVVATVGNQTIGGTLTVTGAATVGGNLIVSGTGPHAIGAAADGAIALRVGGSYTSDGSDTIAIGAMFGQYITAVSGDTAYQSGVFFDSQMITQGGSDPIVVVSQVRIAEPNIQKNTSGDIAIAASVYIHAAPDEGLVNAALYVKAGNIIHADMATSDPSVAGAFWNDSGTVKISAG